MKNLPVVKYRKESDGKYHVDIDDSGRFGVTFSNKKQMRRAIKRSYRLKQVQEF